MVLTRRGRTGSVPDDRSLVTRVAVMVLGGCQGPLPFGMLQFSLFLSVFLKCIQRCGYFRSLISAPWLGLTTSLEPTSFPCGLTGCRWRRSLLLSGHRHTCNRGRIPGQGCGSRPASQLSPPAC